MSFININLPRENAYPEDREPKWSVSEEAASSSSSSNSRVEVEIEQPSFSSIETLTGDLHSHQLAVKLSSSVDNLHDYGNKHKNLILMSNLVKAKGLKDVSVPMPRGIKSREIQVFLEKKEPKLFVFWEQLRVKYQKLLEAGTQGDFLNTAFARVRLRCIQEKIDQVFSKPSASEDLNISERFRPWLAELNEKETYLMVRSTGAEDTNKVSNAGGNCSINYVAPNEKDLLCAVGQVVSSYFSTISLQNRINSNESPFDCELMLAVTIQELIGESVGGESDPKKVPISLVLFTNEPLYVSNERFRVMRISGTYGHGEAVVGNQGVSTDTILILQSELYPNKLYVLYDNQEKDTRLVPVCKKKGVVELSKNKNPPEITRERLIDNAMIVRLFELGIIVEEHFKGSTDIELVVKENVIYPVQARPIVRAEQLPTFIDLQTIKQLKRSPIKDTIKMTAIVSGKGSVVQINNAGEVLIAKSLTEVQEKGLFVKGKHKLVIVAEKEPANSHPVINFSIYGVPCFFVEGEVDKIKELISKLDENHLLAVCVQSENVYLWNKRRRAIDSFISEGFAAHPAKIAHSLSMNEPLTSIPMEGSIIPEDVKDLMFRVRAAETSTLALEALEEIKNHRWISDLDIQKQQLMELVTEVPFAERIIVPVIERVTELQTAVKIAFDNLQNVIEQDRERRLEMLFFAKVLETFLFSNESGGSIGQYSVASIKGCLEVSHEQIEYQRELGHDWKACFFNELILGRKCPVPEGFEGWRRFLLDIEMQQRNYGFDDEFTENFKAMLHTVDELGAMPWFITVAFPLSEGFTPVDRAKKLLELIPADTKPLMKILRAKKKSIQRMQRNLNLFNDPKTFDAAFDKLKNEVKDFLPDNRGEQLQRVLIANNLNKQSPLVKHFILGAMKDLVDLYDSSIKSMKASHLFATEVQKIILFKKMLTPFHELMQLWMINTLEPAAISKLLSGSLNSYLYFVRSHFFRIREQNSHNLFPSKYFSVGTAIIGAKDSYEASNPHTLEDVFTLCHQNMLVTIASLSNQFQSIDEIEKCYFSSQMVNAIKSIARIGKIGHSKAHLIGAEICEDRILLHYNCPILNHSSMFTLEYVSRRNKILKMNFHFVSAKGRWNYQLQLLQNLKKYSKLCLLEPKLTAHELSYTIEASSQNEIEASLQIFKRLVIATFKGGEELLTSKLVEALENSDIEVNLEEFELLSIFSKSDPETFKKKVTLTHCLRSLKKGRGYDHAMRLAKQYFHDESPDLRCLALKLYSGLVDKGEGYEAAIESAVKAFLEEDNERVRSSVDNLLRGNLIRKGLGCDRAEQAAVLLFEKTLQKYLDLPNKEPQSCKELIYRISDACYVFKKLLKMGKGIEAAIKTANYFWLQDDNWIISQTIRLWITLVKSGYAYTEASRVAFTAIRSPLDKGSRTHVLRLYGELVEKDYAFEEAAVAAGIALKDEGLNEEDDYRYISALKLYGKLVDKGHAFEEAEEAIQKVDSSVWYIQNAVEDLRSKLLKKNHSSNKR